VISAAVLGWRHERVQKYDDFIEASVSAAKQRWPHVLPNAKISLAATRRAC